MNFKKKYSVLLLLIVGNFCFSQISGSLVDLTQVALKKNPVLKRNILSVKNAEAEVQIQRSVFDLDLIGDLSYQRTQYHLFDSDPRSKYLEKLLKTNNWAFNADVQKKLRTSQIIEFGNRFSKDGNNFPFNNYSQPIPLFRGDYSNIFNLTVTQPLLRGRGKYITTIPEKTSELIVEVVEDQNLYSASNEMLQIGTAYWNYYNAYRNLEIYKQNEERVRNVLYMTSELVKADKKPSGDLAQIKADLANQEKQTILAEQNLFNARIFLGGLVGLNENESLEILAPVDSYPTIDQSGFSNIKIEALVNFALDNRSDLSASKKSIQALELQKDLAENNLKPTLNLSGFAFYGNTSQGNGKAYQALTLFNSEGNYIGGGARLTLNFSAENNLAKGNYYKSQIALEDQVIVTDNLKRNIKLNISNAVNNLASSKTALERSHEALENYIIAFANEQAKFQTGLTTLLNVILFQERLTAAELEYLRAQQQFALAIVNLRHETGTLFHHDNQISISRDSFYTIPSLNSLK